MKTFNNTNPSGNSQSHDEDYLKTNLTPADEAGMFNNGPDAPEESVSNRAVKGGAWLLGILAIFGVALLICWLIDLNHGPSAPLSARATTERPVLSKPGAIHKASCGEQFMAKVNQANAMAKADKTKVIVLVKKPVKAVSSAASKAANAAAASVNAVSSKASSQADMDRIEKEALEVIHGDFGNNPGRAEKLGADYAAVQARVNQLLHS